MNANDFLLSDLPSTTAIILAIITIIPPTLMALAAVIAARHTRAKVQELHIEVNDRLTQLVESTRKAATAAGELKGAEDERERTQ